MLDQIFKTETETEKKTTTETEKKTTGTTSETAPEAYKKYFAGVLTGLPARIQKLEKELNKLKEEYKKDLESKATNITTNIANNQIRNIEALALFAAFFTFVAINVQVF
ncbi:MAG: hypothetical protein ABH832_03660, partial [bacterium]